MNRLVSSIRGRYAGNRSDILRFSFFSFVIFFRVHLVIIPCRVSLAIIKQFFIEIHAYLNVQIFIKIYEYIFKSLKLDFIN